MKQLILVLATLAVSSSAAADNFMPWTDAMAKADLNGDRMVTMEEIERFKPVTEFPGFQPFMADHFADFDSDGDGMVSTEELERAKERLDMTDADLSRAFFERQGFMPRSR